MQAIPAVQHGIETMLHSAGSLGLQAVKCPHKRSEYIMLSAVGLSLVIAALVTCLWRAVYKHKASGTSNVSDMPGRQLSREDSKERLRQMKAQVDKLCLPQLSLDAESPLQSPRIRSCRGEAPAWAGLPWVDSQTEVCN